MASAHTKRAKGNWAAGKRNKGDAEERQYAREEIRQALAELDVDYLTRHVSKRKPNKRARLEYRIAWYKLQIEKRGARRGDSWAGYLEGGLKKAEAQLAALTTPKTQ